MPSPNEPVVDVIVNFLLLGLPGCFGFFVSAAFNCFSTVALEPLRNTFWTLMGGCLCQVGAWPNTDLKDRVVVDVPSGANPKLLNQNREQGR